MKRVAGISVPERCVGRGPLPERSAMAFRGLGTKSSSAILASTAKKRPSVGSKIDGLCFGASIAE